MIITDNIRKLVSIEAEFQCSQCKTIKTFRRWVIPQLDDHISDLLAKPWMTFMKEHKNCMGEILILCIRNSYRIHKDGKVFIKDKRITNPRLIMELKKESMMQQKEDSEWTNKMLKYI